MKRMRLYRISRVLSLPFRRPLLLIVALIFSGVLYASNLQASVYDIQNPKWVLTMAILILFSPLFHGAFILLVRAYEMGKAIPAQRALAQTLPLYTRLVASEILVNLLVIGGAFLFVLPGVYVGLRLTFYKQAILIDRAPLNAGLKESFRRTAGWRIPLFLLLLLSPFYGLAILVGYAVMMFPLGAFGEAVGLATSALTFAWMNTLLTTLYLRPAPFLEGPGPEAPADGEEG